jgi:hypothetical protein
VVGDSAGELADEARRGEQGRQASNDVVASVLAPLTSERCRVVRDRCRPNVTVPSEDGAADDAGVIDQLVVTSAGVFVVEVRSWTGLVEVPGGELVVDGDRRDADLRRLVAGAAAVSDLLDSWTGPRWSIPVWPVLCLAGDAQVGGWAMAGDAHVVDVVWLPDFIQNLEPQLGPAHIEWAHDALASRLRRVAPDHPSPSPVRHPEAARPEVGRPEADRPEPVVDLRRAAVVHLPAEAPDEPIVFLTRRGDDGDLLDARDEEGVWGGFVDLRSGEAHAESTTATTVLRQVAPHFASSTADAVAGVADHRGGGRLRGRFSRRRTDEIPVVVCLEWSDAARSRLYVFRLEPGAVKTDLGWVDLDDRRTAAVVSGADPILRYCGDRYRSLPS